MQSLSGKQACHSQNGTAVQPLGMPHKLPECLQLGPQVRGNEESNWPSFEFHFLSVLFEPFQRNPYQQADSRFCQAPVIKPYHRSSLHGHCLKQIPFPLTCLLLLAICTFSGLRILHIVWVTSNYCPDGLATRPCFCMNLWKREQSLLEGHGNCGQ